MIIITDSAADFSEEELIAHQVHRVPMQVMFGDESFTAGLDLPDELFWERLLSGEIGKTSQPSPDAFLTAFNHAAEAGEDILYIGVSSALSGTLQSATIAASMLETGKVHIVDTLSGSAAQKLLVLHACRLRDEGKLCVQEIARELEQLRSRIRLYASLDTLDNLARSGRISKAAASIGSLAQLKPIVRITPETEGHVDVCGKAIGRHRAIDAILKLVLKYKIDTHFPIVPLYSYCEDNCAALIKKLREYELTVDEQLLTALGPTLSTHIGPNAYGVAFVCKE
ncbi:MAG: DegV family protein [Clostridia bacterium]|nr:DegV family protein [Clostridia bacterium]